MRFMAIEVDLRPGGRAIMRSSNAGYRVEVLWEMLEGDEQHIMAIREARVIAEQDLMSIVGLHASQFRFEPYLDALISALANDGESFSGRVPRRRPKPGHDLDLDFYKRILAAYNDLIATGHAAPAVDLADRMGENPSTVRGWIHRARKLVDRKDV